MPSDRLVRGAQPRWMRARTGETQKRTNSSARSATNDGCCTPPIDRREVAERRLHARADVDDQSGAPPTRRGRGRRRRRRRARSRGVWRPSPVSRAGSPFAAASSSVATTPRRGCCRGPYTVVAASAVNSMSCCSRYTVSRSTIALATTPRTPRGTISPSLAGRSRPTGCPYITVAGSTTTTLATAGGTRGVEDGEHRRERTTELGDRGRRRGRAGRGARPDAAGAS